MPGTSPLLAISYPVATDAASPAGVQTSVQQLEKYLVDRQGHGVDGGGRRAGRRARLHHRHGRAAASHRVGVGRDRR
jgi:hypothetical protein